MSLGQEPLVTVLTPVYKGDDFLAQCIESVLAEMFRTNWSGILLSEDDESHGHCLHV